MKPARKAFLEGLKALYLEAPPSVVQDLSKRAEAALAEAASAAEDRIYDLLLPGDGYAEKEARKYLQEHRPDLMALLDAADKADG